MSNKDRNKRANRQARQRERAEREALAAEASDNKVKKSSSASEKAPVKVEANKNNGVFGRVRKYFGDVKAEMRRVTWPSPMELRNYSIAVIATLIVFGVAIWLVDTGFVQLLVSFAGLRG